METALMFFGILEENMETTIMGYIGYILGSLDRIQLNLTRFCPYTTGLRELERSVSLRSGFRV